MIFLPYVFLFFVWHKQQQQKTIGKFETQGLHKNKCFELSNCLIIQPIVIQRSSNSEGQRELY